eukprot:jgi/Picsp_1/1623/NSC_05101-R1_protein
MKQTTVLWGDSLFPCSRKFALTRPVARKAENKREFIEFRKAEEDPRYRREDMSREHAAFFRLKFLDLMSENAVCDLTRMAMLVAAEDDSIVSHSSVRFPVDPYVARLRRLTEDFRKNRLERLGKKKSSPHDVVLELEEFLFVDQRFRLPDFVTSNLPNNATVANAGVWEKPSTAYLNSVLVSRVGIPATLAIILGDILRRLMTNGELDCFCKVRCGAMDAIPTVDIIEDMTIAKSQVILNPCSYDALREILQYLVRSYWPFAWETGLVQSGGFESAANNFIDGQFSSAESEAIARTAKHRLERGIWTSPGAGDLRLCVASCERLVLINVMIGDKLSLGLARANLGILYCHMGLYPEAMTEIKESMGLLGDMNESRHAMISLKLLKFLEAQGVQSQQAASLLTPSTQKERCLDMMEEKVILPLTW